MLANASPAKFSSSQFLAIPAFVTLLVWMRCHVGHADFATQLETILIRGSFYHMFQLLTHLPPGGHVLFEACPENVIHQMD